MTYRPGTARVTYPEIYRILHTRDPRANARHEDTDRLFSYSVILRGLAAEHPRPKLVQLISALTVFCAALRRFGAAERQPLLWELLDLGRVKMLWCLGGRRTWPTMLSPGQIAS